MARTLVIHSGALGDVLLAIPALRSLRRRFRENELVLAAQSHIGGLMRDLGEVDAHVRFDALGLDALFTEGGRPAGLLTPGGIASAVCWFGARDPEFARRLRAIVADAVVAPSVPAMSSPPSEAETGRVWQHLVATVTVGAATRDRQAGSLDRSSTRVPRALVDDGRRSLAEAGWDGRRPCLFVHPGASGPAKRWPVDGFARVLRRFADRFTIVVHEGPTDREAARALIAKLDDRVVHLDNPALPVLAGALAHAGPYLGNDSGVSHLASAIGVPSTVLFRRDLLPWAPWAPGAELVVVSPDGPVERDEHAVTSALERVLARHADASTPCGILARCVEEGDA